MYINEDKPTYEQLYRFTHTLQLLANRVSYLGSFMMHVARENYDIEVLTQGLMVRKLFECKQSATSVVEELDYIIESFEEQIGPMGSEQEE